MTSSEVCARTEGPPRCQEGAGQTCRAPDRFDQRQGERWWRVDRRGGQGQGLPAVRPVLGGHDPEVGGRTGPPVDYKVLFESLPQKYLVVDRDLVIIAASDSYLRATLTVRSAMVGRPLFEVFPDNPDDPATEGARNLKASLTRVLRERTNDTMSVQKYDIPRPESAGGGFEERFWSVSNSPVLAPDGTVASIVHAVEDVTEYIRRKLEDASRSDSDRLDAMEAEVVRRARDAADLGRDLKEANEELANLYARLQELDRLKTNFFANVSHELRTPLTLILGPAERILASLPEDDPHQHELEVILRNARVLLGHVNDLLETSKIEAAKLDLEYSELDLGHLVRLVANNFETLALDRSVTFVVRTPDHVVPAQVDPIRLQQVLLNLLSNAFKFTPPHGTIRIELDDGPGGDTARLEVADSGPGIAPDRRSEVFERFHQLDGSSTRKMGGTGLGLHIARELVDLHGGNVQVGDAPEGGALFVVELPVQAPEGSVLHFGSPVPFERPAAVLLDGHAVSATPHLPAAPADGGPADGTPDDGAANDEAPLVLVVEDNPDMNHFVRDALAGSFRVQAAFNGKEGLALALTLRPDLIICDFMMPEMSGDELVCAVRAEPRLGGTPILILTARNDASARIDVLRQGANDYLLKPFFQPELRARADNLIKVRQAELHLRALQMAQERDRIARDLHDLVIQRVFGAGMRLSSLLPAVEGTTAERLRQVVAELDSVISDIRTTIFDLQTEGKVQNGLRAAVRALATDAGERLGFKPRVRFAGPVDTAVDTEVGDQLLAVLRESLSNVVRHAAATAVEVEVAVGEELVLRVCDDGMGASSEWGDGFGLRNMAARADVLGGSFALGANSPSGTVLQWRVPLGDPPPTI
jgi:signal transduction histidine kinase